MREKKVIIQRTESRIVASTTCDICGDKTQRDDWAEEPYEENIIRVENSMGANYPTGRLGETTSYDLCPGCFTDKLEPFLRSLGANPITTDWDDGQILCREEDKEGI
jgi:hypothetical protein